MNSQEENVFDDACDLGQFFVNPCYFLFVNLQRALTSSSSSSSNNKPPLSVETPSPEMNRKKSKQLTLTPRMQQCIYVVGVYGCWLVIFLYFYPLQAYHRDTVPDVHRKLGYLAFSTCLLTWIWASWVGPGDINHETLSRYDNYSYDNVLYFDDCVCPTMHIRKLARSKFDRYTQRQVPRFDHFCGWLNQAIGEDNYRHFLAFLTVHTLSCVYGSGMTAWIFWASYSSPTIIIYAVGQLQHDDEQEQPLLFQPALGIVVWLLAVMAATLVAFWSFHLRNIASGMTTNEYFKWETISKEDKQTKDDNKKTSPTPSSTTSAAAAAAATRGRATNTYDLGIFLNFQEVCFPRSLRLKKKKV